MSSKKRTRKRSAKKPGRPTIFTKKLGDEICRRIVDENITIRKLCESDDMPSKATLCKWTTSSDSDKKDFVDQYARAISFRAYLYAEESVEIADDRAQDHVERIDRHGKPYTEVNYEHIQRSKLRCDVRLQQFFRLLPKLDRVPKGKVEEGAVDPRGPLVPEQITIKRLPKPDK